MNNFSMHFKSKSRKKNFQIKEINFSFFFFIYNKILVNKIRIDVNQLLFYPLLNNKINNK